MPELSFAVGEEDVLVLEAEACGFDAKSGGLRALFAPPFAGKLEKYGKVDSKDIERLGTDHERWRQLPEFSVLQHKHRGYWGASAG